MEDDNEGSSSSYVSKSQLGDHLLDTEELKITDECDFGTEDVPKLDDFKSGVDDLKALKDDHGLIEVADVQIFESEVPGDLASGDETRFSVGEKGESSLMGCGGEFVTQLSESRVVEVASEIKDSGAGVEEGKEMELKADLEGEAQVKMKGDSDDEDEVAVEEKVEMESVTRNDGRQETVSTLPGEEFVESQSQSAVEELVGREKLELGSDLHNVAEDVAVDAENLAMEMESQKKVEEQNLAMAEIEQKVEEGNSVIVETEKKEVESLAKAEIQKEVEENFAMEIEGQKKVEEENLAMVEIEENVEENLATLETEKKEVENLAVVQTEEKEVENLAVVETGKEVEEANLAIMQTKKKENLAMLESQEKLEEQNLAMVESEKNVEENLAMMKTQENVEEQNLAVDIVTKKEVEENFAVEMETEKFVDGSDSALELDDEEDEMETEKDAERAKVEGLESVPQLDDSQLAEGEDKEDKTMVGDEETLVMDTEMETETDAGESVKVSGGKRKRGKNSKGPAKSPVRKMTTPVEGEDVCFICFDGGDLVLCDRKNCPKAYHPSCVNRDEKFFQAKGRWNCGWHQCSHPNCQRNAYYLCYTCTFSLCKGCVKDDVIFCVRANKGFCGACLKIVMLIEDTEQGNKALIDFDDRSSWEYLFKDYWIDLKEKLAISADELAQAKNPCKGSDVLPDKHESPEVKDDEVSDSDNAFDDPEASKSKRRKGKKQLKSHNKQYELTSVAEGMSRPKNTEWASKELLEFVMHMKDGDRSVLSQFDVQALLLDYIKTNKLRDPRRKSQIICNARLENIFGKARVGHFEMLKLLESHFLIKDDAQIDDVQGSVVDTEASQPDAADGNTESPKKGGKDRKRKTRKKEGRGRQSNLDDYAAIDIHNISLIYLRRKLMEDLLEDIETFVDKVVGTYVRIRISGSNQKQDIYRLVQVVGTSKAAEVYKVGKSTTDIMLEILNLNKTEVIPIDTISNQEFTEDECRRLRQSIKCGFISRPTVGDILDKAMDVQVARVNDWLDSELQRLGHLRDRASDMGKKKQLRECVESLQILKTPEERRRRLEEIPVIHSDPNMDPSYESGDNDSEIDSNKQDMYMRPGGSRFSRRGGRELISPGRGDSKDSWSGGHRKNWELNRNLSNKNLANQVEDTPQGVKISADNSWNQGRGKDTEESPSSATRSDLGFGLNRNSVLRSESLSRVASETSPASLSAPVTSSIDEAEKMWYYQDPAGKVQGPFSMLQLRKWSKNGYFPADLKIWKTGGDKDDSILLTDALAGKFQRESSLVENPKGNNNTPPSPHLPSTHSEKPYEPSLQQAKVGQDVVRLSPNQNQDGSHMNSEPGSKSNLVNLPSPTPNQKSTAGWAGGEVGLPMAAIPPVSGNEALQAPTAATLDSVKNSTLVYERSPLSSQSGFFSAAPNSEQAILMGSTNNSLQSSGLTAPVSTVNVGNQNSAANQNLAFGTNSSFNVSGQQLGYGQWAGGVPLTPVQNPAGNFPSQNLWTPPVQNNQSNMQAMAPPNMPWGMGIADNSAAAAQNLQPQQNSNSGWVAMPANPNMGWGQVPNPNMNWVVAPIQGPPPGNVNVNPGWTVPTGNLGPGFQGAGWVAPPGNAGAMAQGFVAPGNANQGWVAPTGNMGPTTQGPVHGNGNPGWAAPTGNLGPNNIQGPAPGNANSSWGPPGSANQGWGSLAGNQGNRRNDHRKGDRFSGQRDRGSDRGRPGICYMFQESGHCKRGDSCRFWHAQS